jgi:pyridoxamine 5'-phosphate oxidase
MIEPSDPILRFAKILDQARKTDLPEPTAAVLATAGADGRPSARVVLLKEFDERGFVFYTNLESRKAQDLKTNPYAALCFYWPPLYQQVRVEGRVEPVSDAEADAYFATRPRGAQIGAHASQQSALLESRAELEARVKMFEEKFAGREVPRPPFWSGYRLIPDRIEFWESRENRLHDRTLYARENERWLISKLYP